MKTLCSHCDQLVDIIPTDVPVGGGVSKQGIPTSAMKWKIAPHPRNKDDAEPKNCDGSESLV